MTGDSSIPVGWTRCRLGDQITLQRGVDITKTDCRTGNVPVISSGGVSAYHDTAIAQAPGVLLGRKGSVGTVHFSPVPYWPHDTTLWVKDFKGNDARFVFHFFKQFPIAHYEASTSNPTLNRNNLHPVEVLWPPVPEQRRIADILDKADAIRGKRKEAIALSEDDLLQSAFMEMVGPQASGYSSWPVATFESLAAPGPGAMRTGPFGSDLRHSEFVDEGVAVLGIDNAVKNRFAWDERRYITHEKYERLKRYTVRPHDVIVTIMGTTGRSAVVPDDIPLAITTKHLATITVNQELVEPEFVAQVIHRHPAVLVQIAQANRGAIMSGLNLGLIKALVVRRPPVERQRQFSDFTGRVRQLTRELEAASDQTETLFASLVHRAFHGELRPPEPRDAAVLAREKAIESFARLDFEANARHVYDAFLLSRPEVIVEGLFRRGSQYFIVSPALSSVGPDGAALKDWIENNFVPFGLPFHLVAQRPDESIELQPRSAREVAESHGVVRTWPDSQRDLALWLPREIPYVDVADDNRTAVLRVSRSLTAAELATVERTQERLGSPLPMRVEVVPAGTTARAWNVNKIELKPARLLSDTLPKVVRDSVADDDEFWRASGPSILLGKVVERVLPWSDEPGRSCLVSTTFPPSNLRSYLSLYPAVVLVAPLAEQVAATLDALGISRKEMIELARRGSVRFLFPQSIIRYDANWLAELIEAAPESLVLSRRLAAAALTDQHRRNPLFTMLATAYEKRSIIRILQSTAQGAPPGVAPLLRCLATGLSEYWASAEYTVHMRGAMASLTGGLASFGTAIAKEVFKKDLFIEIGATAQNVEWAGALGAHLVPEEGDGYSSESVAGLLLAISSGAARNKRATASPREFELAEDLLAFDNDTNILDFVTELGDGDLGRFRTLVRDVVRPGRTPEEVAEIVEMWNAQVRHYERRPDHVRSCNIVGLLLAAGSFMSPSETIHTVVPLVSLLLPYLLTTTTEDKVREIPALGELLDWSNGTLAGAAPQAVLLSRMRKRVAGMKAVKAASR